MLMVVNDEIGNGENRVSVALRCPYWGQVLSCMASFTGPSLLIQ